MADLNGFNAHNVDPTAPFEPLPAGTYVAAIVASEIKPTKKGDGQYLQLEFAVLEGECKGRKAWDRLCINHPNEMTQKIARGSLSAICRAVGVMTPGDSAELHNIPLQVVVACKKRQDNGEIANEVKGYSPKTAPAPAPAARSPQAPVNDSTPPWQR